MSGSGDQDGARNISLHNPMGDGTMYIKVRPLWARQRGGGGKR